MTFMCSKIRFQEFLMEKYPEWFPAKPMTTKEIILFVFIGLIVEGFFLYFMIKSKKRKRYRNNVRNRNR